MQRSRQLLHAVVAVALRKPTGLVSLLPTATDSVQQQLRRILRANAVRVIDLFRQWDEDMNGVVSKAEFREALPQLGCEPEPELMRAGLPCPAWPRLAPPGPAWPRLAPAPRAGPRLGALWSRRGGPIRRHAPRVDTPTPAGPPTDAVWICAAAGWR